MKVRFLIAVIALFLSNVGVAQQNEPGTGKGYLRSSSELIFSMGDVDAGGVETTPVLRFSGFFHLQEEYHYDFSRSMGIFTGLGIRNVGMINKLNDSIKVKQRVYSLAVPVALKFGNMNGFHISAGGEAELFFHYKQKTFYDDEKFKKDEWFSDKVNLFNPSVFLQISTRRGTYFKFKYYLMDFLVEDKQSVKIYSVPYPYSPSSSKLFYISVGNKIKPGKKRTRNSGNDGYSSMN